MLKINDFVKVTGFYVKNDNDIFIVDNQYSNGEYCLKKVTLSGTQSKTKYSILFLKAKHFADPTLTIEVIPNVAGLKQAKKEVNDFLKGITAEEKVFSFVDAIGTDVEKGTFLKVIKSFGITSSMYSVPKGTIYEITSTYNGNYNLNMVGKRGEKLSTTGANGCNKVILTFSAKSIAGLFSDGDIVKVERIESTKGEIANTETTETIENVEVIIPAKVITASEIEEEIAPYDEYREQLVNKIMVNLDHVAINGDIEELTTPELEAIITRINSAIANQIISITIDTENYAIITTGNGSYKCNYAKDEYFSNEYYIEEIKIDHRVYGLNSFVPYIEEAKQPITETSITAVELVAPIIPVQNINLINPINEALAQRSKENMSFSSYTPNSATMEYNQEITEVSKAINSAKSKVSPEAQIKLDNLLLSYSSNYANWINKRNANGASHVSSFISGPSNYNMSKHNKYLNREGKLWEEYEQFKNIQSRINAIVAGDKIIKSNDVNAIDKLKEKLEKALEEHAGYKVYNSNAKKEGKPSLPAYVLQNSNGRIKGIKDRIAHLERLLQQESKEIIIESESTLSNGIKIVDNVEAHRLQIFFNGKPSAEIRTQLKKNGFRWTPTIEAWQSYRSDKASKKALEIVSKI